MGLVDTPRTLIDPTTRELVVPEPSIPFEPSVLDRIDEGVRLGNEVPWTRPGRYPLRSWFLGRSPEHLGTLTLGVAVTAALPLLYDLDDLRAQIDGLAELFASVDPVGIWYQSVNDLVEQVQAAL
jgi:hypothetical protein